MDAIAKGSTQRRKVTDLAIEVIMINESLRLDVLYNYQTIKLMNEGQLEKKRETVNKNFPVVFGVWWFFMASQAIPFIPIIHQ
jgi:hypothetical protein